jgi:hypothetical protein
MVTSCRTASRAPDGAAVREWLAKGLFNKWRYMFRPGMVRLTKLMKLKEIAEKRGMLTPLEGEPVFIDNRELTGFIPGFRERDCRKTNCGACGWWRPVMAATGR